MSESVETLVKQILAELSESGSASQGAANRPVSSDEATAADYPISKKHPDWIRLVRIRNSKILHWKISCLAM